MCWIGWFDGTLGERPFRIRTGGGGESGFRLRHCQSSSSVGRTVSSYPSFIQLTSTLFTSTSTRIILPCLSLSSTTTNSRSRYPVLIGRYGSGRHDTTYAFSQVRPLPSTTTAEVRIGSWRRPNPRQHQPQPSQTP